MKKNASTLSRIDEQVFQTMAVVSLIALVVLAFRFKYKEPCFPIKISVNGSEFYEGAPVYFKAETKNGKKYAWDFGDHSVQVTRNASITHIYRKPGKYTVVLTVNDQCQELQHVYVTEVPMIKQKDPDSRIIGPVMAFVNQPLLFKDSTPDATSWEWRFGETGNVDGTTREVNYIYTTPGEKTIYLMINGRPDRVVSHTIFIREEESKKDDSKGKDDKKPGPIIIIPSKPKTDVPKAPSPVDSVQKQPDVKPAPEISHAEMVAALKEVVAGKKNAAYFSPYLCDDLDKKVTYNGAATTFRQMCDELAKIKKVKKIKAMNVVVTKNGVTGCITNLNVTVEKKSGFLGIGD